MTRSLARRALDDLERQTPWFSWRARSSDYATFAPLVRRGGLVALHDINPGPHGPDFGVPRFWQDLKPHVPTVEFIDVDGRRDGGMGIGLVTCS